MFSIAGNGGVVTGDGDDDGGVGERSTCRGCSWSGGCVAAWDRDRDETEEAKCRANPVRRT